MIYDETHPGADEYTALDRLDGQRIVATVRRDGRSAETVQDVQAVWELLTGRDIEWGRVTIGGRQGDGSSSWLITVPPAQYRRDRFLLWVGDCDVQESVDSWEWRSGIDFSCPPPPLPRSVTTRRPGPPPAETRNDVADPDWTAMWATVDPAAKRVHYFPAAESRSLCGQISRALGSWRKPGAKCKNCEKARRGETTA